MILGFIGTGKISSSIIFGIFKSKLKIKRIYISSRNRNIAKKLSKSYGKIKVLNNNQEIIDKSSVILLGVTPNVGNKILPKLKFSNQLIKKINNEVDQILDKKSLLKKLDYSKKLVGQVKQEFQLPKSFVKKNLEKVISNEVKKYVFKTIGKKWKKFQLKIFG